MGKEREKGALGKGGKISIVVAVIVCLGVGFFAGWSLKSAPTPEVAEPAEITKPAEDMYFRFIGHWPGGDPFSAVVVKGWNDAVEELGCQSSFDFCGGDVDSQITKIQEAVATDVDGIITTIISDTAFDGPIQDALDSGVNVICANADDSEGAKGNPRKCFIGQTFYTAGQILGRYIGNKMTEEGIDPATLGEIPVYAAIPTAPWCVQRTAGISDALEEFGVDSDNVKIIDCGGEEVFETRISAYITGHPDLKMQFTINGIIADRLAGIMESVEINPGDILTGVFDTTSGTIDGIGDGYITVTIDQQPYLQGYCGAYMLYLMEKYDFIADLDTGKAVVDSSNLSLFKELSPLHVR